MSNKLSLNFNSKEFKCKCSDCQRKKFTFNNTKLIVILELLREHLGGKPIKIVSGYRCPDYNKSVGGAEKSQHMLKNACDIQVTGVNPKTIYDYLNDKYPNEFGLGLYKTFVHIDVRDNKARW